MKTNPCWAIGLGLSVLGAFLPGPTGAAQLAPGDRIRVEARGIKGEIVGSLLALDSDQLRLIAQKDSDSLVVQRPDIVALARSAGRHSRGHGAAIGALIGFAVGGVLGLAGGDDPSSNFFAMTAGEKALAGGVAGGLVGALVGALVKPAEKWEKLPLEPTVIGLHGSDPAPGVAFTLRF